MPNPELSMENSNSSATMEFPVRRSISTLMAIQATVQQVSIDPVS